MVVVWVEASGGGQTGPQGNSVDGQPNFPVVRFDGKGQASQAAEAVAIQITRGDPRLHSARRDSTGLVAPVVLFEFLGEQGHLLFRSQLVCGTGLDGCRRDGIGGRGQRASRARAGGRGGPQLPGAWRVTHHRATLAPNPTVVICRFPRSRGAGGNSRPAEALPSPVQRGCSNVT
jgi:hypothetical protein